jgi:hypothetical protein
MVESSERLPTLQDLRSYVADTLSRLETLDPNQHPLSQVILHRSGSACGIQFCMRGPRAIQLTAIWDAKCNTILFYSSRGERVQQTRLLAAPQLAMLSRPA